MTYTSEQKKKLRKVLVKSVPKEVSIEMLSDLYSELKDSVPVSIGRAISPHAKNILVLKEVLSDVPDEIEKSITKLDGKITKAIHDNSNKLSSNLSKLDREINLAIFKVETKVEEEKLKLLSLDEKIKLLEKEVKDLWWSRKTTAIDGGKNVYISSMNDVAITNPTNGQILQFNGLKWINVTSSASGITLKTNGSNNGSQTILNLKQGTGITVADDGVGGVTITNTGSAPVFYTETPSGLINSSNKTYTTTHTMTTVFVLAINGQFLHPTTDYTFTGTTITMVNALDSSLSGTGFTICYN